MLHFIVWLIIGGVAGWLAGKVMSGHGYGVVVDVILGIVGSLIGGFIARALFGVSSSGLIVSFIIAFIGACILVALVHLVKREPLRT